MSGPSILQFILAHGIGDVTLKRALAYVDEHSITWDGFVSNVDSMRDFGLSAAKIQSVVNARGEAYALNDKLVQRGIHIIVEGSADYPAHLQRTLGKDCPPLLFAKGRIDLLNRPSVGFCGSRKASDKGLQIAASCSRQLVGAGLTIVSGYAAGTDITVHQAALENSGTTVFVLPEGILRTYEKNAVRPLLTSSNHVFVSQFLPDAAWSAGNAMKRNSVIIGLSQAMILVESALKGGTFAAGEEALRTGCPLFVVDYAQPEVTAEANPYFISRGGNRLRGVRGIPNVERVKEIATVP